MSVFKSKPEPPPPSETALIVVKAYSIKDSASIFSSVEKVRAAAEQSVVAQHEQDANRLAGLGYIPVSMAFSPFNIAGAGRFNASLFVTYRR
jgi:hypothetical protein